MNQGFKLFVLVLGLSSSMLCAVIIPSFKYSEVNHFRNPRLLLGSSRSSTPKTRAASPVEPRTRPGTPIHQQQEIYSDKVSPDAFKREQQQKKRLSSEQELKEQELKEQELKQQEALLERCELSIHANKNCSKADLLQLYLNREITNYNILKLTNHPQDIQDSKRLVLEDLKNKLKQARKEESAPSSILVKNRRYNEEELWFSERRTDRKVTFKPGLIFTE